MQGNKNTLKEQILKIKCLEHEKQIIQLGLDQNILPSQRPLCEYCLNKAIMIPISIDRAIVMLRMIQDHDDIKKDQEMVSLIQQCLQGGERPLQIKDLQTIGTLLQTKFTKIRDNFVLRSQVQQGKDRTSVDTSENFAKQKKFIKKHSVIAGNQTIIIKESTKYEAKSGIEWIKTIIETEETSSSFISTSFSPLIKIWQGGKFKELKIENQFVRCVTLFDDELIACFSDMSIRIWKKKENNDWSIIQTMKEQHKDEIQAIVIHFETFITGSYDSTLKVYSRRHNKKQKDLYSCIQLLNLDQHQIICMQIKDDTIVFGTRTGVLGFCYFTDHWKCLYTKTKHTAAIQCIAFKNDENLFASGADDRQILLWYSINDNEFQCIQEIKNLSSYIFCISFHPTFPAFLCGGLDNKLQLYILNQQEKWQLNQEMNKDNPITTITFLKDNFRFYIGTSVGSIILHEIDKQQ